MSLTAAVKAFFSLGHTQPLLLFTLGTLASLATGATACVYYGTRCAEAGPVATAIFAMFAAANLVVAWLALPYLRAGPAQVTDE